MVVEKNPNGIKSEVTKVETRDFVTKYMLRYHCEWKILRPSEIDGVAHLRLRKFALYQKRFELRLRIPISDFQKKFLSYFRLAPTMFLPNLWRFLNAFEALYKTLEVRLTPTLFQRYYTRKGH